MKKLLLIGVLILIPSYGDCFSGGMPYGSPSLQVREYDHVPSSFPIVLEFPNGTLEGSDESTMTVTFIGTSLGGGSTRYIQNIGNKGLKQDASYYVEMGSATKMYSNFFTGGLSTFTYVHDTGGAFFGGDVSISSLNVNSVVTATSGFTGGQSTFTTAVIGNPAQHWKVYTYTFPFGLGNYAILDGYSNGYFGNFGGIRRGLIIASEAGEIRPVLNFIDVDNLQAGDISLYSSTVLVSSSSMWHWNGRSTRWYGGNETDYMDAKYGGGSGGIWTSAGPLTFENGDGRDVNVDELEETVDSYAIFKTSFTDGETEVILGSGTFRGTVTSTTGFRGGDSEFKTVRAGTITLGLDAIGWKNTYLPLAFGLGTYSVLEGFSNGALGSFGAVSPGLYIVNSANPELTFFNYGTYQSAVLAMDGQNRLKMQVIDVGSATIHGTVTSTSGFKARGIESSTFTRVSVDNVYHAVGSTYGIRTEIPLTRYVWHTITGSGGTLWESNGETDGFTMTGDTMTVLNPGDYGGDYSITYYGTNANDFQFKVEDLTSGATVQIMDGATTTGANNNVNMGTGFYFEGAMGGDEFVLRVRNMSANNSIFIRSAFFKIKYWHN